MIFVDAVLLHGRLFPTRPAIMTTDRIVTFGMLGDAIHSVAARLHAAGLKPGDIVVVALASPVRFIATVSAAMRLGLVVLPARPEEVRLLPAVGAKAVVTDSMIMAPVGTRSLIVDARWFEPTGAPYPVDPSASDPARLSLLALTSGTTGQPKLIPFTVEDFDRRVRDLYRYQPAPGTERDLLLIGLNSQWAIAQAARVLVSARTLCIAENAEDAVRLIDLYQVGTVIGSPHQLTELVSALDQIPASCRSLRLVKTGGSSLSKPLLEAIKSRLCRDIIMIYGSTEAGRTAMATTEMIESEQGCVGIPVPDRVVEIVDDADQPVPVGTSGRVRILTPGGGRAYEGGTLYPDRTPDWFYPGDVGYLTPDGRLVVAGRSDDLINSGGLKIAPERVEALVAGRTDLADAAAFGVAGPAGIDEIWLAVVPRGPLHETELLAACARQSELTAPRRLLVVDAIPRNAMGKVERAKLRAKATGRG